ncbi:MAG: type II secretion system F family protein [Desulfosalsimonas sp.]
MPIFSYSAIDSNGDRVKDRIEATDQESAVNRLMQEGLTVIEIVQKENRGGVQFISLGWVRTADVVLFFRMFAALIDSGIPISEAVAILHEQTRPRKFKSVLADIRRRIEGGTPLSGAMAAHPRVFDDLLTGMIRAAELGGILDKILERIADFLERRAALKRKVITTMIYPAIVAVAAVLVVIFMVSFVIPKFAILLGGRELPANTQFLLEISNFLNSNAAAIGFSVAGAAAAIALLLVMPETRIWIDRYRVYFPVIGPVFRFGAVVQFSSTMASLLESGITLVDALKAAGETMSNLSVRRQVEEIGERVSAGEPISEAMAKHSFFPPMVVAMVKVGEHSGLMDQAWDTVGKIYERLLADKMARMSAMVEPALILVLGGLVGYVAWGLVAGMLAMYAAAS